MKECLALLSIVEQLNARREIDGILVQLPLPPQVDTHRILLAILPAKDVDGLHPCNVGNLVAASAGTALVVVTQIKPIYVTFTVPERDLLVVRQTATSANAIASAAPPW